MIWYTQVEDEIFDSKNMIASLYSSPHLTGSKFSKTEHKHNVIKCKKYGVSEKN